MDILWTYMHVDRACQQFDHSFSSIATPSIQIEIVRLNRKAENYQT
jgi:hypothetical protein